MDYTKIIRLIIMVVCMIFLINHMDWIMSVVKFDLKIFQFIIVVAFAAGSIYGIFMKDIKMFILWGLLAYIIWRI